MHELIIVIVSLYKSAIKVPMVNRGALRVDGMSLREVMSLKSSSAGILPRGTTRWTIGTPKSLIFPRNEPLKGI